MADEVAWLVAQELPRLRRYARALKRDAAAADDLVQDCVERALRKRHLWRRQGSIRSWLLRMLYRVHLNGLRSRRTHQSIDSIGEVEAGLVEPARQVMRVELREMAEALERLPDEQRDTVTLVALEGLSYDEAAMVLGVPVGTVRSRLSRGRAALADMRRHPARAIRPNSEESPHARPAEPPHLRRVK